MYWHHNWLRNKFNTNITLNQSGIYEITLCGQISGVDQSHGVIFYLSNTNGAVIQDLSFELKAGTTSRMDCSETIITKIEENQVNYLVYTIDRDAQTSNIFVSKLINGNLEDIQNPEEKQKVN